MENEFVVTLNSFSHYMYCKRRWGLMFIEGEWQENHKTIEGDIVHSLVDNPFHNESRNDLRVVRSLPVYHDQLCLYGIADCVEFTKNDNGAYVKELGDRYNIHVIEYKNGKPQDRNQINKYDAVQLVAQMMCLNSMFKTQCEGSIYYNAIRRRVKLVDFENYTEQITSIISEMKSLYDNKIVPSKLNKQNCNNCSLYDVCMPKVKHKTSVHQTILDVII